MEYILVYATVGVFVSLAYVLGIWNGWEMKRNQLKKKIAERKKIKPVENKSTPI